MQDTTECYADSTALEAYNLNSGREIVTSILVDGTAAEAFDAWLHHVRLGYKQHAPPPPLIDIEWLTGYKDLAPGTGRGLVGHTRLVPLGIVEQIVSAEEPSESDPLGIPSISYKLRKFGPFAIKDHIGLVRFVQDASSSSSVSAPKTLVLWTIKTKATVLGNVLLCGGAITRMLLRSALTHFLHVLQTKLLELKRIEQ